jgi:hypothetical protein
MNSKRVLLGFVLGITISAAAPALAAEKPINISIFPPLALVKPEDSVTALRLNLIYGKNASVKVVDLGLINHTTSGVSSGLQWGGVNYTEGEFSGLQLATVNFNKGTAKGLQWGFVNYTAEAGGLQVAFVNYAQRIKGVQIGGINIIKEGGMFPVMVIANWGKS